VARFAEAMRTLTATPEELGGTQPKRPAALAGVPFGDRMAASKVLEGAPDDEAPRRWLKPAIAAGAVLLFLLLGATGLLTRHGFFYYKVLRGSGERARIATLASQASDLLSRDELGSDQAALAAAEQGISADDREPLPAALFAVAVASLDRRHAAPAPAVQQARTLAAKLASSEPEDPATALASLAVATIDGGAAPTGPEAAAEKVKGGPPPDALDLLGEAAMGRGDAARAAVTFQRLEAAQPNTVRAARALGQAAAAKGDLAGARGWFEKALARSPGHLPTLVEVAVLAEGAGELEAAQQALGKVLAKENEARLGTGERARALGVSAALLGRRAATANAADEGYEAALVLDPRQASLRLALARLRLRRGDPARAVAALEPLATNAAGDPALAELRARALAASGRVLDASTLVDAALQRSPGSPPLLVAKGVVLEAQAKPAEARKLYEEAVGRSPGEVAPRVALGRLALAEKDLPAAEVALTAAAEKGPRDPGAQSALGDLKAVKGDVAGAETSYRAALLLDPEYAGAELGLAQLAAARGDQAAARSGLEKVLALEPRNAAAHAALGRLRWKENDLEGAEKSYATAVQLAPKNALAQIRLGAVKLLRDDATGALEALTIGTGLDPTLAEGQHWLGRALLAKGENPGALARLRRAVEQEPANAVYRLHLGIALERTNAAGEAVEVYKESAAADPKFTEPLERLGLLYTAAGNCPEAVPWFEKALAIAPKVSRFKLSLADCRLKERKGAEALRLYREVLKADPAEVDDKEDIRREIEDLGGTP
jgi:tetratricopeptide (TPR) repeat protein